MDPLPEPTTHVYGKIPADLAEVPAGSVQCSPRVPGASPLGLVPAGSSAGVVVHAPASVIERRRVLALALRALATDAPLVAIAHNTKGGTRLAKELESFGCEVVSEHKRHHRIVSTRRPAAPAGLDEAIADGDAILLPDLGLWSQPGLFNWDRIDPGSALLIEHLPRLDGRGADLGCGIGVLARAVRESAPQAILHLIDIDARALDTARRNLPGEGIILHWTDVRSAQPTLSSPVRGEEIRADRRVSTGPAPERSAEGASAIQVGTLPSGLDFVVCNPPFHDGGEEDKSLGMAFLSRAAEMLRAGGMLWLTANRHLPYEAVLARAFESVELLADRAGFKIYAAKKAVRAAPDKKPRAPGRPSRNPTPDRRTEPRVRR